MQACMCAKTSSAEREDNVLNLNTWLHTYITSQSVPDTLHFRRVFIGSRNEKCMFHFERDFRSWNVFEIAGSQPAGRNPSGESPKRDKLQIKLASEPWRSAVACYSSSFTHFCGVLDPSRETSQNQVSEGRPKHLTEVDI